MDGSWVCQVHFDIVTPYGDMDLGQHWLTNLLLLGQHWRHEPITWTIVDWSLLWLSGINSPVSTNAIILYNKFETCILNGSFYPQANELMV